jgi:hypothetical protein
MSLHMSSRWRLYGFVLAVAVTLLAETSAAQCPTETVVSVPEETVYAAAWSPDSSRLTYYSDSDGDYHFDIYIVEADGANRVLLWEDDDFEWAGYGIDWSGDNWIFFILQPEREIYKIRPPDYPDYLDTLTRITFDGLHPVDKLSVSPSSTKVVFTCEPGTGGDYDVCSANTDGTDGQCMINPGWGHTNDFSIYPDSSSVLYATANSSGYGPHTVYGDFITCSGDDWDTGIQDNPLGHLLEYVTSPDQSMLLHTDGSAGDRDIMVCDLDGLNCTPIVEDGDSFFNKLLPPGWDLNNPQPWDIWSADSSRFFFSRSLGESYDLHRIASDGSEMIQVTCDVDADEYQALLSPDGTKLAYIREAEETRELVVRSAIVHDCNGNGIADECDIASGTSADENGNGIPDECEPGLDIKPGSCPNPLNRGSLGVLPVALVGKAYFDATTIDVSSVVMFRVDGIGWGVGPHEGPLGPHSLFEDVATPFVGDPCDCHDLGGDGIVDLSMKFKTVDVVEALELNDLPAGAAVELVVVGSLLDGTEFEARDCITIVPESHLAGTISSRSSFEAWGSTSPLR